MTEDKPHLGWYSRKQLLYMRARPDDYTVLTHIYRHADGHEVELTEISSDGPRWDDAVCLGPVVDWIRDGMRTY